MKRKNKLMRIQCTTDKTFLHVFNKINYFKRITSRYYYKRKTGTLQIMIITDETLLPADRYFKIQKMLLKKYKNSKL